MKTSEAEANGWRCPKCGDDTKRDPGGKGYVQHVSNAVCHYGHGEKDANPLTGGSRDAAKVGPRKSSCPTCFMPMPANGVCGNCS